MAKAKTVVVEFTARFNLDGTLAGYHVVRQIPVEHEDADGKPVLLGGPMFAADPVEVGGPELKAILGEMASQALAKFAAGEGERETLRTRLQLVGEEARAAREDKIGALRQRGDAQKRAEAAETQTKQVTEAHDRLQASNEELKKQLATMAAALEGKDKALAELSADRDGLQAALDAERDGAPVEMPAEVKDESVQ